MKTFFAVAVIFFTGALAAEKRKCFRDDAIVHEGETFEACIRICKEKGNFQGEITPEIYQCMLKHFEVVDANKQVDLEALKNKLKHVAQPNEVQNMLDLLDKKCTMKDLQGLASCLDLNLEQVCNDGEM